MNDVVWYDTEESRRSLLAKARKVALTALQQYDLEWDRIQFIQLSDTITYKIKTSTEQNYLLRIHSKRLSMGRLHEVAAGFVPPPDFVRPQWGADSFRREMARLERYYSCFLSDEAWKSYQAAFEKIVTELAEMHRNDHNYGLIHADLHSGNIVFNEGRPHPIDFGRCGYGYYLYDMAGALLELHPRQRRTFIQGYESIRKLETDYVRHLQCFFIMFMIENYCHHAPDPRETSNLLDEQPYAQAYIRDYLKDVPFLFCVIEPVKIDWSE